ncbi:hypothetical protein TH61_00545 [Rufibacter sp. DG15C]|uniref:hypothetical protein n=1 Tax=Rufibacter sp. DG15C TaxID=1379909 RepID=UPI00078E8A97|nr:hypothetical protein [Rufibacter sp. DG15C]AMM49968.1 hypothetical protein TH61_00545 [Rufibacter sp. DG15C]
MFNEINKPYKDDLPLILELGLDEFILESNVESNIGTVDTEDYSIDVYVTCAPSQFWRFDIFNKVEGKRTVITTGSGMFTQYWDVAKMIGQGLVAVKYFE